MRLSHELRNRAKQFSSSVIRFYMDLPSNAYALPVLGKQLLRSGTSVASHTREACRARTDAEFCSKLDVLLQEADESLLWLEHLMEDCGVSAEIAQPIHRECDELIAIFTTTVTNVRRKS